MHDQTITPEREAYVTPQLVAYPVLTDTTSVATIGVVDSKKQ